MSQPRRKTSKHHRRAGGAFTLIELLVVITIITLMIALLLPVLSSAKEAGRMAKCLSNERQIAVALNVYVNESKEWWPVSAYPWCGEAIHTSPLWAAVVAHYAPNPYVTEWPENAVFYPGEVRFTSYTDANKPNQGVLKCPSEMTTNAWGGMTSVSYGYNGNGFGMGVSDTFTNETCPTMIASYGAAVMLYKEAFGRVRNNDVPRPSAVVLLADEYAQGGYEYSNYHLSNPLGLPPPSSLATYHLGGTANLLWVDGHATARKAESVKLSDFARH